MIILVTGYPPVDDVLHHIYPTIHQMLIKKYASLFELNYITLCKLSYYCACWALVAITFSQQLDKPILD